MSYSKREVEKASDVVMGVGCFLATLQLTFYGVVAFLIIKLIITLIHHFA